MLQSLQLLKQTNPVFDCENTDPSRLTSIVVSAKALRNAPEGQEGFFRLSLYGEEEMLELSRGGKYALVMAVNGAQAWYFWRPAE